MPPPAIIAGNLPFDDTGSGLFNALSADNGPAALAAHYQAAYQNALNFQRQNYQNVLRGFQQQIGASGRSTAENLRGYRGLLDNVMTGLQGVGREQRRDISEGYSSARAGALQQMIDSGLSNSTVTASINRGLTLDEQRAKNQLAESLARLRAGYQSQIGGAAQAYRQQAQAEANQLGLAQLGFMNSVSGAYPDAGQYMQIANMLAAARQAEEDRSQVSQMGSSMGAVGGGGGGGYSQRPIGGPPPPPVFNPGIFGGGGGPAPGASGTPMWMISSASLPVGSTGAMSQGYQEASAAWERQWGPAWRAQHGGAPTAAMGGPAGYHFGMNNPWGSGFMGLGQGAQNAYQGLFNWGGGGGGHSGGQALQSLGQGIGGPLGMMMSGGGQALSGLFNQGMNYNLQALGQIGNAMGATGLGGALGMALGALGQMGG